MADDECVPCKAKKRRRRAAAANADPAPVATETPETTAASAGLDAAPSAGVTVVRSRRLERQRAEFAAQLATTNSAPPTEG